MTNDGGNLPTLRFPVGSIVTPGDRLGTTRQDLLSSNGTYVHGGHVYSSVLGTLKLDSPVVVVVVKGKKTTKPETLCFPTQVVHPKPNPPQVLRLGQVVLGRVVRLSIQQAFVNILAEQGGGASACCFSKAGEGIIRREDVRAGATEQVRIQDMFRPGDLVLCRILSLGDRRYVLGTAEPALGVVQAYCETSRQPMIPLSWKEMQCPVTGQKESRKCAKPPKILLDRLSSN
ncbi:hypothetical protein ACA910_010641 [Epithemia clementina (nom. ined.)]